MKAARTVIKSLALILLFLISCLSYGNYCRWIIFAFFCVSLAGAFSRDFVKPWISETKLKIITKVEIILDMLYVICALLLYFFVK